MVSRQSPLSIAYSMLPSQESTRQGFVNPGQFPNQNFWEFDVDRDPNGDTWNGVQQIEGNLNYFTKDEGHQDVKNGMFNQPNQSNPIYGHVDFHLNHLDQEQTNAHMSAYRNQKKTRIANNISPYGVMHFPTYQYPSAQWQSVYPGRAMSTKLPP